jgi:DNA-directed RNA polymerase specialized sigma24 family protein
VREEQRNLIHRMAAQEPGADEEFYEIWHPRIRRWIADQVPHQKVEDYAQEVWNHLSEGRSWLRLLRWDGLYDDEAWHPHSLKGFLRTVTTNKVVDLWRTEPRIRFSDLDPVDIIDRTTPFGNDPLIEAERWRLIAVFEFCSSWFRDKDHTLIRMWLEDCSGAEIADAIETNANNVYQRTSYIFRRLQECLTERLPEYFRRV